MYNSVDTIIIVVMTGSSRCCLLLAIVCVTISLQLFDVADGQAYHFSKGWMPGRKRSDAAGKAPDTGVNQRPVDAELDQVCAIKAQGYQLALDVLKARLTSLTSSG